MAKIDVINQEGKVVSSLELNDAVFGIEPNQQALFDALKDAVAGRRQGTASTKGRSEVSGGGRKPYRQKGTGRARQVLFVLHSSVAVELYSELHHVITATVFNKKYVAWLLKSALSEKWQKQPSAY